MNQDIAKDAKEAEEAKEAKDVKEAKLLAISGNISKLSLGDPFGYVDLLTKQISRRSNVVQNWGPLGAA